PTRRSSDLTTRAPSKENLMKKATPLVGAALAAALLLSGCSMGAASETMSSDESTSSSTGMTDTVNSDGAALRATLTSQFSDHVYLASAALHAALAAGGDLTEAKTAGAVAALDA